jgi:hypothetical protein
VSLHDVLSGATEAPTDPAAIADLIEAAADDQLEALMSAVYRAAADVPAGDRLLNEARDIYVDRRVGRRPGCPRWCDGGHDATGPEPVHHTGARQERVSGYPAVLVELVLSAGPGIGTYVTVTLDDDRPTPVALRASGDQAEVLAVLERAAAGLRYLLHQPSATT